MLRKSFQINPDIYDKDLILSGIKDFEEVSEIEYSNGELIINDENPEYIFNELFNYILGLYNELN